MLRKVVKLIISGLLKILLMLRVLVLQKRLEDYEGASYLTMSLVYQISYLRIMRLSYCQGDLDL